MSVNIKKWIGPAVLVVLVAAGGLGAATADYRGQGHGDRDGHCDYRQDGHMGGKKGRDGSGRHTEGRLAFLKAELGITAEQEPAWETFAGVVRENADKRDGMRQERRAEWKQSQEDGQSLDERLDRRVEGMERHLAMLRTMVDATKALYTELTPAQQAVAEELLSKQRHRRFMLH